MSTEKKLKALRRAYAESAGERFDRLLEYMTESPIEQLLLGQMLADGWVRGCWRTGFDGTVIERAERDSGVALRHRGSVFTHNECDAIALPQLHVGPYRADFAFVGSLLDDDRVHRVPVRIAVELDGHDFHEKTKEQASKDKRRDRNLARLGWTVLRFSGADVYRDPAAVMDEIVMLAQRRCNNDEWLDNWRESGGSLCERIEERGMRA